MSIKRTQRVQRKFNPKVKVNSNSNLNSRMVRSVSLIKRRGNNMEIVQNTDGKKVANALRFLRNGFLEARGISQNDNRIKDILEVRKNEK